MKIRIKGHPWDLLAFKRLVPQRRRRIRRSLTAYRTEDPMNRLARQLHPSRQELCISAIRDETATSKTFRLVADPDSGVKQLAYFRAGQYLSFQVAVDGHRITRPYSISSAPWESLGEEGFYEITIRRKPGGFLSDHIWQHWHVGTPVTASDPSGFFYHEPLRDAAQIVGIAGGSGITPFRSMAREICRGSLDAKLLLLYGSSDQNDMLFFEELERLTADSENRIQVIHILSCDEVTLDECEQGFITAETIARYADVESSSFFICGPPAMREFVKNQLTALSVPSRRIRYELFGETSEIARMTVRSSETGAKTFRAKIWIGGSATTVPARAGESLLVALERANLAPPSRCRTGECGFCRAQLVNGEVLVPPESDRRRAADRELGYVHLCTTYPMGDVELTVPRAA